mmetsp:Transcript_31533/g.38315  ORF Transcript_31533/g.38315 Transcript_31533/m.38315 type:complete len:622 (-) Transcript_31533:77-1942(-)|eukprot:CAMPEP_0194369772 /NCGR_PEP_ID=MMETSP0174-20130528/18126_1 /TAXON_ID=216777 /ORGANISM="Proboscia alata, Strain PI-D3" /LENGTH=621 /DNA_ID=CAMNT_0039146927 /DNA_START=171 /DNA_END=2036 /DNA_ORIENTATION=-
MSSSGSNENSIQVAIRMRPLNSNEKDSSRAWMVKPELGCVMKSPQYDKDYAKSKRYTFNYDKVYNEESTTEIAFNELVKPLVNDLVDGIHGTIFAYGTTGSGKTFTMHGYNGEKGFVQMAAQHIFTLIGDSPHRDFLIRTSFIEVYNEEVRDLLSISDASDIKNGNKRILKIKESKEQIPFVDCVEVLVGDADSLVKSLFEGQKNRVVATTGMNEYSSRSHSIFRITIESESKGCSDDVVLKSTLSLVDLAGSENAKSANTTGQKTIEGGNINKSLLALSTVIEKLGQPKRGFVNYRDSKLTRILQPSLGGNAKIAIICCASPSAVYMEETLSTLKFASRAKLVKTRAMKNEVSDSKSMIKKLQRQLGESRALLRESESRRLTLADGNAGEAKLRETAAEKILEFEKLLLKGGRRRLSYPQSVQMKRPLYVKCESMAVSKCNSKYLRPRKDFRTLFSIQDESCLHFSDSDSDDGFDFDESNSKLMSENKMLKEALSLKAVNARDWERKYTELKLKFDELKSEASIKNAKNWELLYIEVKFKFDDLKRKFDELPRHGGSSVIYNGLCVSIFSSILCSMYVLWVDEKATSIVCGDIQNITPQRGPLFSGMFKALPWYWYSSNK